MAYPNPEKPVSGAASFAEESPEAAMSRAAVLLHLSRQLEGATFPAEESILRDEFAVPSIPVPQRSFRLPRPPVALSVRDQAIPGRAELARELFDRPSAEAASLLGWACLDDADELTRVAAATLCFRVSVDGAPAVRVLAEGARSEDELVREVAATALARIEPRHAVFETFRSGPASGLALGAARTTMLVHGTWARHAAWWQPGGSFHNFLLPWRPDLYRSADRFEWTGGYSPAARSEAATSLIDWITEHGEDGLSLMTHSHGGSVAFLASWGGPSIGDLILLSCPVHDEYSPNFSQVRRLVSVRVKWDLVILADGGGQRFEDPRIKEIVLPVWFNHSATHEPDVWSAHGVAAKIDAA